VVDPSDPKQQLASMMGISYNEASAAYIMFDGDMERAANYLLSVYVREEKEGGKKGRLREERRGEKGRKERRGEETI
jgi:hypothetical protein